MLESTSKLCSIESEFKVIGKSNCEIYFNSISNLFLQGKPARSTVGSISVKTLLVLRIGSSRQGPSQDPNCGLGIVLIIVGS